MHNYMLDSWLYLDVYSQLIQMSDDVLGVNLLAVPSVSRYFIEPATYKKTQN